MRLPGLSQAPDSLKYIGPNKLKDNKALNIGGESVTYGLHLNLVYLLMLRKPGIGRLWPY